MSVHGLSGAEVRTAVDFTPLGVSLVGALLLSYLFPRSPRAAGVVVSPAELLARAGSVVALFTVMTGGLVRAGHDVVTVDGARWGCTPCRAWAAARSSSRGWGTSGADAGPG